MNIIPEIKEISAELGDIFKDLHANPELGFEEVRTSGIVKKKLQEYGVDEIHTNLGGTGVVGVIKGVKSGNHRKIGLRADMDALPIQEDTNLPYASKINGRMHACGHDGHTTMLLGASKYLAKKRNFSGTAIMIFQPAEEGLGGAVKMIQDGLFEKFPCDEIYGIHNTPNGKFGKVGICKGIAMAGAAFFDLTIKGKGSHAAMPHQSKDPIVFASILISQLQTIVSRELSPLESVVLSVTQIHSGSAYNVIPETCSMSGTIRFFSEEVFNIVQNRFKKICEGLELTNEINIKLQIRKVFDILVNDYDLSDSYMDAAEKIVGPEFVSRNEPPATGSEDFADMLKHTKGAYCRIGHSGTEPLHSPKFIFDEKIIPVGASILARIIEERLPIE